MAILTEQEINHHFISSLNIDLWNNLKKKYDIKVNDSFTIYELEYTSDSPLVIIKTDTVYQEALFTHELLHLNLRFHGLNTVAFFQNLNIEILRAFALTICNCIEHVLFFDDFVDMGFDKTSFVMDYNNLEYNLDTLKILIRDAELANNKLIFVLIVTYAFWTLKNEEYMGVDRQQSLKWLKNKCPTIFNGCTYMFQEIIDFDVEAPNVQFRFNNIMSKYLKRNYRII